MAQNARCVLTVGDDQAHIVLEGEAEPIRERSMLQRVADAYSSKYS